MKVKIKNNFSKTQNISSRVLQGLELGPLLFLIFINDLPHDIKSEIKLFADDVKILVRPMELSDIFEVFRLVWVLVL